MREAFGKPLLANQYIQYTLSELVADIDVLHGFLHHTAERYVAGEDVTGPPPWRSSRAAA